MRTSYVDTDVIIRLLTGDDPQKQKTATALFEKVARDELVLLAPVTVIADSVYVLASAHLYHVPRVTIRDLLASLLRYSSFKVESKQTVLAALDIYADLNIDFSDALLVVVTAQSHDKLIYSYDHDFDKIPGITRKEP